MDTNLDTTSTNQISHPGRLLWSLMLALLLDSQSHKGYRVMISDAGTSAVGIILRESPDLGLIDYQMPAMNGLEIIKRLRELLKAARAPGFISVAQGIAPEILFGTLKKLVLMAFLLNPYVEMNYWESQLHISPRRRIT